MLLSLNIGVAPIEPTNEYGRNYAKWNEIERNIRKLIEIK